jgi:hypothetical protein
VTVVATCVTNPECQAERTVDELPCIECPTIKIVGIDTEDDVGPIAFETVCQPDGTATLSFNYDFTNTMPFFVEVEVVCDPLGSIVSGSLAAFSPGSTSIETVVCNYPTPSAPQIVIWFRRLQNHEILGCPPVVLDVPPIERCEGCPELPDVIPSVDGCTATFTGPAIPVGCQIVWNFDDGSGQQATGNLNNSHTYSENGTFLVSIGLVCGGTCFATDAIEVVIRDCGSEPPPPDDEGTGCTILRLTAVGILALGIVIGLLALCLPAAATALGIAAGIISFIGAALLVFYAIFCPNKPCRLSLLLSGQVLFAAGLMAIVFSACCNPLIGAGAILIFLGAAALGSWAVFCNISMCKFLKEISFVYATVLATVGAISGFVALTGILSILLTCLSGTASAIIGLFAAITAAGAVQACQQ